MTDNEIFETEIKCINRRSSGKCNGGTDCCNCDLLMNEKDIISAYERAIANSNLINRQQSGIERLKGISVSSSKDPMDFCGVLCDYAEELIDKAKSEAIKDFAEHLKEEWFNNYYDSPDVDFDEFVDNLLKEMVGEG